MVTFQRINAKQILINKEFVAKKSANVSQNMSRRQLVRLMLTMAANGTSIPNIAASHFWCMPARSAKLAAAKMIAKTQTPKTPVDPALIPNHCAIHCRYASYALFAVRAAVRR